MTPPTFADAIRDIAPEAQFVIVGGTLAGLDWHSADIPRPTDAEIVAKLGQLQQAWADKEYQRLRAEEYPGIDALIVALWEQTIEGRPASAADLQVVREAIKAKYPKPA